MPHYRRRPVPRNSAPIGRIAFPATNVQTNPQGYAPLHSAAFAGHVEAIRVLLAHGADLHINRVHPTGMGGRGLT